MTQIRIDDKNLFRHLIPQTTKAAEYRQLICSRLKKKKKKNLDQ